jgi:SAM-dependent methyltransferase
LRFLESLQHRKPRRADIDDPASVAVRRGILSEKRFLRKVYEERYRQLAIPALLRGGAVLELGSGPGFLREYIPSLILSDIIHHSGVDVVLDAARLPFGASSLDGIAMVNVLHHVANARRLLSEAGRCVVGGGAMVMIEPWVTGWSRWVYKNLHHEPFRPDATSWEFPSTGTMSGANSALPWIIFGRDANKFREDFPQWRVASIDLICPFKYLASGGFATENSMPGWSFCPWSALEILLAPWKTSLAMFARITLIRV